MVVKGEEPVLIDSLSFCTPRRFRYFPLLFTFYGCCRTSTALSTAVIPFRSPAVGKRCVCVCVWVWSQWILLRCRPVTCVRFEPCSVSLTVSRFSWWRWRTVCSCSPTAAADFNVLSCVVIMWVWQHPPPPPSFKWKCMQSSFSQILVIMLCLLCFKGYVCNIWRFLGRNSDVRWSHLRLQRSFT